MEANMRPPKTCQLPWINYQHRQYTTMLPFFALDTPKAGIAIVATPENQEASSFVMGGVWRIPVCIGNWTFKKKRRPKQRPQAFSTMDGKRDMKTRETPGWPPDRRTDDSPPRWDDSAEEAMKLLVRKEEEVRGNWITSSEFRIEQWVPRLTTTPLGTKLELGFYPSCWVEPPELTGNVMTEQELRAASSTARVIVTPVGGGGLSTRGRR
ncbi:unnamed protein product [Linum trigynum]|uniref:Uncharacterized protein n=1 Tax=Linum trigynum TaxID=586398 RepID=A0AAV2GMC0_9ROSI